ncbi:MAG: hypothetical protein LC708_02795, partial [Actinobacteria bacterium]|nr:hypothetical protein [Actinomycetota bacterium]
PPPPPPPRPTPASTPSDDAATKAAGTALLGRLRGRRAEEETPEPEPAGARAFPADTSQMPVVGPEDEDGFPVPDYERLRATELLARLPDLDRNQLEAVRQREASGKNRFTVMSRIDSLLATKAEPAWEVDDDEWEDEAGTDAESEAAVIEAEAFDAEEDFGIMVPADLDEDEDEDLVEDEFRVSDFEVAGEVEDDEVDELVSPADTFPIAGYDSLTVGQILPRLSDLDADELAEVRAREQQGRGRGTILDRIDRLAAKSGAGTGALAMPPASPPARKAPARKAPAARATKKAPAAAPPMKEAVRKARAAKAPPAAAPVAPKRAPRKAAPAKAPSVRKVSGKAALAKATAPAKAVGVRKVTPRKAAPEPTATPMKEAVKKARAAKKRS